MKEQTATKHDGLAWQRHRTVKSNEPEPEDTDITAFCINLTHNSDQSHRSNLWLWLWRQKLMDKSVIKNICKGRRSRLYQQQSRPYWQQIPPRQAVKLKLLSICCRNRQQSRSYRQQSWMYRQQIPPRQAVKFTLLWIYCQSQQHSWTYRQQSLTYTSTVDFVADVLNSRLSTKSTVLNSTLLPVCTWLKSTTWF